MFAGNAKTQIPSNLGADVWAPEVNRVGDAYYAYYSVSQFGEKFSKIGVAISTTMECGTWKDLGPVGIASGENTEYNAIDASLLNDGDKLSMVFGSFWNGLNVVNMNSPTSAGSGITHVVDTGKPPNPVEGPNLVKIGKYFYLFFSEGFCCHYDQTLPPKGQEYKIKVCRSDFPEGPFADKVGTSCLSGGGTVVLGTHSNVYGPGGQSVFHDKVNGLVMAYHYAPNNTNRADASKLFGWNKLSISEDHWPFVS